MRKLFKNPKLLASLLVILLVPVVFIAGYAIASMTTYSEHVQSWNEAVARGLIEGEASYYFNGEATDQEYYHALMTAILAVDDKIGGQPSTPTTTPPTTTAPSTTTSTLSPVTSSTTTTSTPASTTTSSIPATTTSTTVAPTTTTSTTTTSTTLPPTTTTTTLPPTGPAVTITAGIHQDWSVEAMDNTLYLCEDGAILDGGGTVKYAFYGDADNVTIDGCEIRNYDNPAQHGAINAGKQTATGADNWTITDNEIHHNWGAGIYLSGTGYVISDNYIHHQHQLGVAIDSGAGLFEGNEIAWNNYEVDYNWGWEAGGTKFWETDGLVVRGNYSHNNHGPGLWDDYNNINIVYEDNIVEDNYGPGIFHEIGYAAIVRNNEIRRNGFGHAAWLWGAGVVVAASQDTQVYGNVVEDNYNGITLVDQCRAEGGSEFGSPATEWSTRNNYVHGNTVINSGITGGVTDCGFDEMFVPGVNTFWNNTYTGDVGWAWDGNGQSWNGWLGYHPNDGP